MNKNNSDALLSLLKDPDSATFEAIADSLTLDVNTLEGLWRQADDKISLARLDWLIHRARLKNLLKGFSEWRKNKSDILEVACLIASYQYPDLVFAEIEDAVSGIVKDVWLELHDDMTPREQIEVINRILFDKHGMQSDNKLWPDFSNLLINNILHFKKGSHLGLAILYISVAQKLSLPIFSVPSLRVFSLAYVNDQPLGGNVVFYIDQFNRGAIFDATDAKKFFIKEMGFPYSEDHIQPCSNEIVIHLLVEQIKLLYEIKGMKNQVRDMEELISVFNDSKIQ